MSMAIVGTVVGHPRRSVALPVRGLEIGSGALG